MTTRIHFDMSEDEYHATKALSASGIKAMCKSPMDFWIQSWLNPERVETESRAKIVGSAYHTRIIEGHDKFKALYTTKPVSEQQMMVTASDMKEWLHQQNASCSGDKASLKERIKTLDPSVIFWDEHKDQLIAGRTILSKDEYRDIELAAFCIEHLPEVKDSFKNGYPEVSIFWVDNLTGVQMKARLDYLKIGSIFDLKTFQPKSARDVRHAAIREVYANRYDIQAVLYLQAAKEMHAALKAGNLIVDGNVSDTFISQLKSSDTSWGFGFIFCQKITINIVPLIFTKFDSYGGLGATPHAYWRKAQNDIERATRQFKHFSTKFKDGAMWLEDRAPYVLNDTDFPLYFLEE